ncbi:bactericidal permeability-increasing protein-like [Tiliqua scincoides]|uniref:bactericidal permeability-increasing protein-like n=1 Tax=Tiliqua scincoides TaxID=71010 RepID=UPI003461F2EF
MGGEAAQPACCRKSQVHRGEKVRRRCCLSDWELPGAGVDAHWLLQWLRTSPEQVTHRTCPQTLCLQKMFWLFVLPLCTSGIQAEEVNAGLKVQVTQKGLEFGRQLGMQLVQSVRKKQFQDIEGSYNVPLLGNVQYSVSGIWVSKLQVNNSTIGFSKGAGVNLRIQDGQIGLNGNWKLAASLGEDSGTADINIRQLSLSAVLGIGSGDRGHPRLWCASCHSTIGDIDFKFSGRASWLYNMAASVLKRSLQSEVNKHVCSEFKKGSAAVEKFLSAMNVSVWIDPIAELDCSIVNQPVISADSCKVDLKGEFFRIGQLRASPLVPAPFLLPDRPDSMLLLGISEFVANSAAFVYFTAGALQANYTDKEIPKNFPFRLNTKSVGLLLPELKQLFPDMPMKVCIAARKRPVLSFHPGGVDATVFASVEAFVVLPNASLASVFLLNIDGNFTGQFLLEPGRLGNSVGRAGGSLALKDFHLSQQQSSIGKIQTTFLEKVLKVVLQLTLTRVNRRLKKGLALPNVYNVSLVHPTVTMSQGFMLIATDLNSHPQGAI